MSRLWTLTVSATLVALAGAGCSPQRQIDPRADQALKDMSRTLAGAQCFRYQAVAAIERPVETGQLAQFTRHTAVCVARPDRMHSHTTGEGTDRELCDAGAGQAFAAPGKENLVFLDHLKNQYAALPAPATLEAMFDYLADTYGLTLPVADLLFGDTYESLIANVRTGEYLGLHEIDGRPCHHLLVTQDNIAWQIWIDAGKTPLPCRMVIVRKTRPGCPQATVTLDGWDLAAQAPDSEFQFTPAPPQARAEIEKVLPRAHAAKGE